MALRGRARSVGPRRFLIRTTAALALLAAAVSTGPAVWAHEGEESESAHDLVLQAVAFIVNTPGDMESIEDKVKDAQRSEDSTGVKVALVRLAQRALEDGDMTRARDLLQRSISARADLTGTDVQPILQTTPGQRSVTLATAEDPGTQVVTDEMPGRGGLTGTDVALLIAAGVLAAGGVLLSTRYRPVHSVHALRAAARRRESD